MPNAPHTPAESPEWRVVIRRKAWDDLRAMTGHRSDEALAAAMHVSQPTVSRVMAGTQDPSGKFIGHAMAAFGRLVPFERLFLVKPIAASKAVA